MDEQQTSTSAPSKSSLPMIIIIIVILVVAGGGIAFAVMNANKQPAPTPTPMVQQMPSATEMPSPTVASTGAMMEATGSSKMGTIQVEGQNFSFTPKEIKVKKGDTVKITFTNKQGTHNFIIDGYNVQTKTLSAGQSETVSFVANKAGTFEYYCGIGNHRAMGMKGNLIVQ